MNKLILLFLLIIVFINVIEGTWAVNIQVNSIISGISYIDYQNYQNVYKKTITNTILNSTNTMLGSKGNIIASNIFNLTVHPKSLSITSSPSVEVTYNIQSSAVSVYLLVLKLYY